MEFQCRIRKGSPLFPILSLIKIISPVDTYEMWQISNKTDILFTKVFFFKHQYYPLQNSSLGQLNTDGDIVPTFDGSVASLQPLWSSSCLLYAHYTAKHEG